MGLQILICMLNATQVTAESRMKQKRQQSSDSGSVFTSFHFTLLVWVNQTNSIQAIRRHITKPPREAQCKLRITDQSQDMLSLLSLYTFASNISFPAWEDWGLMRGQFRPQLDLWNYGYRYYFFVNNDKVLAFRI